MDYVTQHEIDLRSIVPRYVVAPPASKRARARWQMADEIQGPNCRPAVPRPGIIRRMLDLQLACQVFALPTHGGLACVAYQWVVGAETNTNCHRQQACTTNAPASAGTNAANAALHNAASDCACSNMPFSLLKTHLRTTQLTYSNKASKCCIFNVVKFHLMEQPRISISLGNRLRKSGSAHYFRESRLFVW
jgi:hypothetical protein